MLGKWDGRGLRYDDAAYEIKNMTLDIGAKVLKWPNSNFSAVQPHLRP